jgi:hypothetical protein
MMIVPARAGSHAHEMTRAMIATMVVCIADRFSLIGCMVSLLFMSRVWS